MIRNGKIKNKYSLFGAQADKVAPPMVLGDGEEVIEVFVAKVDGSAVLKE